MVGQRFCVASLAAALVCAVGNGEVLFKETFSDADWRNRWVDSTWKGSDTGAWDWGAGEWYGDAEADKGMVTSTDYRFYGISSKIEGGPHSNEGKDLVVQFSVKNEGRSTSFCGGGYIKLLGSDLDQENFGGDTPYSIMFGPDLCGYDVSRIHLIFNYKGENLLKKNDIKLEYSDKDEFTHLYTLHLKPDNTYTVYFDQEEKSSGPLPQEWDFPAKEIDDPASVKPADWVDEQMMLDPSDVKPEGYDDIPEKIPDPSASKPDEWDDDDDGEWDPPLIDNPEYNGPWVQKMMENPDYKGEWKAAQIPNPDYDPNTYVFKDLGAVGFELWVVNSGSIFDNIFVGDSLEEAQAFAAETWAKNKDAEVASKEAFDKKKEEEKAATEAAEKEAAGEDEGADSDSEQDEGEKVEL